ncbi:DUF4279 domain-containing protein [Ferruginibacter sp.]|nr:DUF4279 domain-containing protein [Ferruginibacter sp.]
MVETRGYTYFAIATDNAELELSEFKKYLTIAPTKFEKMFERGTVPKFTKWKYASGELKNPHFFEEVEKLITALHPYKEEFKKLKVAYPDLNFFLEVVIYLGDESPGLHFSNTTIEFLNYLGAEIDCDIYNDK